jgi:iron complex transport system substrate-binding protein
MPVSLEDVLGDVITIANALGVSDRGTRLVDHLRRQLSSLESTALDVLGDRPKPKVAHVEWLAPLMGSGYWITECMAFAGGEMVHGYAGGHSQILEKIELLSTADYIIISPCGFSIERSHEDLKNIKLLESKEWQDLPAVKNGRVAIADGNKCFNRSSVAHSWHGGDSCRSYTSRVKRHVWSPWGTVGST